MPRQPGIRQRRVSARAGRVSRHQNALAAAATALINLNRLTDALIVVQHAGMSSGHTALLGTCRFAGTYERRGAAPDPARHLVSFILNRQLDKAWTVGTRQPACSRSTSCTEAGRVYQNKANQAGRRRIACAVSFLREKGELIKPPTVRNALALDPRNTDGLKLMA